MDQEFLMECMAYAPETGEFFWRERPEDHFSKPQTRASWNAKHVGKRVGTVRKDGYVSTKVNGKEHMLHRLAWLYVFGRWPSPVADHIDRDRKNNRISNLREASLAQNSQNCTSAKGSSSRFLGVSWNKKLRRWTAQICVDRKLRRIGVYADEYEAAHAYIEAKRKLHT